MSRPATMPPSRWSSWLFTEPLCFRYVFISQPKIACFQAVQKKSRYLTAICVQCVDITFVEPNDPRLQEVNETNCFNSSDLGVADIYTLTVRSPGGINATSGAEHSLYFFRRGGSGSFAALVGWMPVVLGGLWILL